MPNDLVKFLKNSRQQTTVHYYVVEHLTTQKIINKVLHLPVARRSRCYVGTGYSEILDKPGEIDNAE